MNAYRSDQAWSALGDRRRAIVDRLAERPRAVGELADELPISRPAVSQHLKMLKDAGLVSERVAGTRRIYRLDPAGVAALRDQLDTYWSRALAGYQDAVERPDATGDHPDATGDPGVAEPSGQEPSPPTGPAWRSPSTSPVTASAVSSSRSSSAGKHPRRCRPTSSG
ncbi:metalloregulator ArsR/SmtB family transcription factor [Geodermatophilus sp. DF01_2]|uniref:ArsR/SmtB family transcription factor n=1 Tax=Geodermatophilus sp. DF01-2 TaxID=2559610 RepID=UPI001ADDBD3B|nr:metalloregulator ArsR/SmtB family transcription factor [Geodermatophilus sp. DF01_2]